MKIQRYRLDLLVIDRILDSRILKSNKNKIHIIFKFLKLTILEFFINNWYNMSIVHSRILILFYQWQIRISSLSYPIISTTSITKFSSFVFDCIIVASKSHQIHFCSRRAWLLLFPFVLRPCWAEGATTFICNRTTFSTSCCRNGTMKKKQD